MPDQTRNYMGLMRLFDRLVRPVSANTPPTGGVPGDDPDSNGFSDAPLILGTQSRPRRYEIYRQMAHFDLVSSALSLFAEETTQIDYDRGQSIWIESSDRQLQGVGQQALRNVKAEDHLASVVYKTCQFGDDFRRLMYQTGAGVLGWQRSKPDKVQRKEDAYGRVVAYLEDGRKFRNNKTPRSWPWDYVHFRLLGPENTEEDVYGASILQAAYRAWRQLALAEDALLMYRLRRMPERNMIMLDTGQLEDAEAMAYANRWRKAMKKTDFVDPASGDYVKRFNPLTPFEDLVIPIRGQQNTQVTKMSGGGQMDRIYDLEHYRNKFFGSMRIPPAYMSFERDLNSKASLVQMDVRFARTCKRIRRAILTGFRTLVDIHFALIDADRKDSVYNPISRQEDYLVQMAPISYLDEYERQQHVELRASMVEQQARLGRDLELDPQTWAAYLLTTHAQLPEDLVIKLTSGTGEKDANAAFEAYAAAENMPEDERQKWRSDPEMIERTFGAEFTGGYELSRKEKKAALEALKSSPKLQAIVGRIRASVEEDMTESQIDQSVRPPQGVYNSQSILGSDTETQQLLEGLKELETTA